MLHEFIAENREAIIARTQRRVRQRPSPCGPAPELEHGVPLFLTQLTETLRLESSGTPFPSGAIGGSAARHGAELLAAGFDVGQVVHDYGDVCQAVTECALELNASITVAEFHTLNRCVDTAIAEAVSEHTRVTAASHSAGEAERVGQVAHDLRDLLNSATVAFYSLKGGVGAVDGSTGAVLGRSLMGLGAAIDRSMLELRIGNTQLRRERLDVGPFLDEIATTAGLHAEYRQVRFSVEPPEERLTVHGDPQLLRSAVMNLLHNAFKNTQPGGHVRLAAHAREGRLIMAVHDECGGLTADKTDLFQAFGERRGIDRSGLGLGLSIARKAVRAHEGDIEVRNVPGKGCIFIIDLPLTHQTQPA